MATHGAKEVRSYRTGEAATSQNRKAVLKRARRRSIRGGQRARALLMEQDMPALGIKPLDQWDAMELARGRPRDKDGKFRTGPLPKWLNEELKAEIEKRFKQVTGQTMHVAALEGMVVGRKMMRRASSEPVRLDAAKFFMEQVFGKAVQKVSLEGALKIESLLGVALVNPDGGAAYGFELPEGEDDSIINAEVEE